jgi:hypothetical protein
VRPLLASLLLATSSYAGETAVKSFVDSIKSVEQVKQEIREALSAQCGAGSCWNMYSTRICDLTAGLDVKVGYRITDTFTDESTRKQASIQISPQDLKLMKLIFSQCKPSNYQYWNFGQILHVQYTPSDKVSAQVNRLLGVKPE